MEPNNFQTENTNFEQEETSIVEILFHYLRYWKWFLISTAICLAIAGAYLFYATPQYKIRSTILINDEKKGQTIDVWSAFTDLGINTPKGNLDNEIEILRSRSLMKEVVDSLRIDINYYKREGIKKHEIYRKTPLIASIPSVVASGEFTMDYLKDNIVSVRSKEGDFEVAIGEEVKTPWGLLTFYENPNPFENESFPIEVTVKLAYLPKIDINAVSKTSSVVEISYITPTPTKGQDIVNTLVDRYNKNAIEDKNFVANSTIMFINGRLESVTGELKEAERNVEGYLKKVGGVTPVEDKGHLLFANSTEFGKKISESQVQLEQLRQVQNYLVDSNNKSSALPVISGINDPIVLDLIKKYNEAVINANQATVGMQADHPKLKETNDKIASIRNDLMRGVGISESSMRTELKSLQRQDNMFSGKQLDLSTQARESRELYRQQNLKETLFNYLLQKREDTGLTLVMATPNAKVIDGAFFDPVPVQPKKMIIMLAALLLAVIIPVIIIYIKDLFDNKIHSKEDVTRAITAPMLGIVPVLKGTEPFPVLRIRSSMAERFRTIISNLEFIVGSERRKIITVTSYTSGDGKSFFSRNLAMTLATTGKKTLLIDLDLRKSVLVKTLGTIHTDKGSATFLSDPKIKINEIIDTSHTFHRNLDIIPVHVFPPNPAELLSSERLEQLFQAIGRDYDYIVVDTAPIGLVADIYNINAYALSTIFLLRADFTLKKILPEIQELYKTKKLNNLSVVLNAVSDDNIYGYGYGYGKYGHYKHNYYTDGDEK